MPKNEGFLVCNCNHDKFFHEHNEAFLKEYLNSWAGDTETFCGLCLCHEFKLNNINYLEMKYEQQNQNKKKVS